MAAITRAARALPADDRDAFFEGIRQSLNADNMPGREPTPAEVAAAIENGLAALSAGGLVAPFPNRFREIDRTRPVAPDFNARGVAPEVRARL
ncbi:MAG TPA: hypothetical protein VGI95_17295 [Caulobacteraceae bacterium]